MELLYIWIEGYKNIHKQGFNFSSEWIFDFNDESRSLSVIRNNEHIDNFFENENIINITTIVGQNGTGKSSILEYLKEVLINGGLGLQQKGVVCFRKNKQDKIKTIYVNRRAIMTHF